MPFVHKMIANVIFKIFDPLLFGNKAYFKTLRHNVLLPDPGVSGVRSMGPGVSMYKSFG